MTKHAGLCQLTFEALHAALQLPPNVTIKSMEVKPATKLTKAASWAPIGSVIKIPCEVLLLHLEGGELPPVNRGDPPRWVQPMYELSKDGHVGQFQLFAVLK